jgi:hypothetical protein
MEKMKMERQRRIVKVESNWFKIQERFVHFNMVFNYSEWIDLMDISLSWEECLSVMEKWK